MFGFFDRYVRKLKGHYRVRSAGAAQRVGDWYVEGGKSYVVVEVRFEALRIVIDVEELGPLTWWTRGAWILGHVAIIASPAIVGWLLYG